MRGATTHGQRKRLSRPRRDSKTASTQTKSRRGSQQQDFNGIHRRRDRRYPFAKVPASVIQKSVADAQDVIDLPVETEVAEDLACSKWSEAIMLWLSWNSTYEKVTQRMFQDNKNPEKLQGLMDEMDQLRRRAVALSEDLIG